MITSNKPVAEVMQKVHVNAATDITGFGLKGHSANMAMLGKVDIVINNLYVIPGTPALSEIFGYPLLTGEAKETAGGILMAVSKENADDLQSELEKRRGALLRSRLRNCWRRRSPCAERRQSNRSRNLTAIAQYTLF